MPRHILSGLPATWCLVSDYKMHVCGNTFRFVAVEFPFAVVYSDAAPLSILNFEGSASLKGAF